MDDRIGTPATSRTMLNMSKTTNRNFGAVEKLRKLLDILDIVNLVDEELHKNLMMWPDQLLVLV